MGQAATATTSFLLRLWGAICCQANGNINTSIMKILEIYAKDDTNNMGQKETLFPY